MYPASGCCRWDWSNWPAWRGSGRAASRRAGVLHRLWRRRSVCAVELRAAPLAHEPGDAVQQFYSADDDDVGVFRVGRTHHATFCAAMVLIVAGRGAGPGGLVENFRNCRKVFNRHKFYGHQKSQRSPAVHHEGRLGNPRTARASQFRHPQPKPRRGAAARRRRARRNIFIRAPRRFITSRTAREKSASKARRAKSGQGTPSRFRPARNTSSGTPATKRCGCCAAARPPTNTATPSSPNRELTCAPPRV